MNQHVDFLRSIQKTKGQPQGNLIMIGSALLCLLFFIYTISLAGYQIIEKQHLAIAQEKQSQALHALQLLVVQYPLLASEPPLSLKIAQLEKSLHEQQRLLKSLTHTTARIPFSQYMNALAQSVPDGLQLIKINIDQNRMDNSLEGLTVRPLLMTLFLEKLQKTPPFTNAVFTVFAVKKNNGNGNLHRFEVANKTLLNPQLLDEKKHP